MSTVLAVLGGVQAGGMLVAGLVGTGAGLTVALEVQGCLYLTAGLIARGLTPRARRGRALQLAPWHPTG